MQAFEEESADVGENEERSERGTNQSTKGDEFLLHLNQGAGAREGSSLIGNK
jgi:hypothetical protein